MSERYRHTTSSPQKIKHRNSSAIVAVSDLARARGLYSDVLGLELDESGGGEEGVLTYRTGATRLVVYESQEAGHNRGNAVVWGPSTSSG